jgi:rhamnosyltransferase
VRKDICAIIVTYFPTLDRLEEVITRIRPQCEVLIVHNSDGDLVKIQEYAGAHECDLIVNDSNVGIAAAQNQGIKFALANGCRYVLLLDQDSVVCDGFLQELLPYAAGELKPIVSGRAIDARGHDVSNTEVDHFPYVEQRDLMSSGTLIHHTTIAKVGLFEEELFIDCVDFEWGWRARACGKRLLLVRDAHFAHSIGDGHRRYKQLPAPVRHYYQSRNTSYMLTRPYVPLRWKVKQLSFFIPKILKILLFGAEKKKRVSYIFRGLRDYSKRRMGPYIDQ